MRINANIKPYWVLIDQSMLRAPDWSDALKFGHKPSLLAIKLEIHELCRFNLHNSTYVGSTYIVQDKG